MGLHEHFTFEGQKTRLEKSFFPVRVKGAVLEVGSQGNQEEERLCDTLSDTRQSNTTTQISGKGSVLPQVGLNPQYTF